MVVFVTADHCHLEDLHFSGTCVDNQANTLSYARLLIFYLVLQLPLCQLVDLDCMKLSSPRCPNYLLTIVVSHSFVHLSSLHSGFYVKSHLPTTHLCSCPHSSPFPYFTFLNSSSSHQRCSWYSNTNLTNTRWTGNRLSIIRLSRPSWLLNNHGIIFYSKINTSPKHYQKPSINNMMT